MNILFIGSGIYYRENATGVCINRVLKEAAQNHNVFFVDMNADGTNSICRDGITYYLPIETDTKRKRNRIVRACDWAKYAFLFPFSDFGKTRRITEVCADLCVKHNVETIVAVFHPFESLYAGWFIKLRHPQYTFIPCYIDAIGNPYIVHDHIPIDYQRHRYRFWEKLINKEADSIIYLQYAKSYIDRVYRKSNWKEKIRYLDIPQTIGFGDEERIGVIAPNEKIILYSGYIGTHRNLEFFLKVFHAINDRDIRLYVIGKMIKEQQQLIKQYIGFDDRIVYLDYIEHDQLLKYLRSADVFLNFGVKCNTAISAKVFEYAAYKKPIIITHSINDEPSLVALKNYPCVLAIDESGTDFEKEASRVTEFIRNAKNCNIDDAILSKVFFLNSPQTWVEAITSEWK